jgi:hypothetical protein
MDKWTICGFGLFLCGGSLLLFWIAVQIVILGWTGK